MAFAANPPKITEWMAPMRAQASTAMASSGVMPMYTATRSPFLMPSRLQRIGKLLHLRVQLAHKSATNFTRLPLPDIAVLFARPPCT